MATQPAAARKETRRRSRGPQPKWAEQAHLKPAPMPRDVGPMLCTLIAEPFDDPAWIFEPKFDGLRVLARFDGRQLSLLSRNGKEQGRMFPEVAAALRERLNQPAIVDGEVVCFDDNGRTSFRALQQRFHLKDAAEIERRRKQYPASIYLFDVLYLDRYLVTGLPLAERKPLLKGAVRWGKEVRWTEGHPEHGIEQLKKACQAGEEGIIGKRLDSRYESARSSAWVKIKCVGRQELVIGGYTDPMRSRVGLGALLVGYYDDKGRSFSYAGKVGTGFSHQMLLDLHKQLRAIEQPQSPFDQGKPPSGKNVHWVRPRLVSEIGFTEWTQNGLLRHPRFEGLRPDKSPRECRRERPKSEPASRRKQPSHKKSRRGSAARRS